jgi:hypothetical protein
MPDLSDGGCLRTCDMRISAAGIEKSLQLEQPGEDNLLSFDQSTNHASLSQLSGAGRGSRQVLCNLPPLWITAVFRIRDILVRFRIAYYFLKLHVHQFSKIKSHIQR